MSEQRETVPGKDRRRISRFVRGACLIGAIIVLWSVPTTRWPAIVPALSPFVAATSPLVTRTIQVFTWIGLVVGCIVLVRPRWFCRWICPLGHCAEGPSRLGRRLGRRPARFFPLGQWILWLTLGSALVGWPLLLWLDPLALFGGLFGLTRLASVTAVWVAAIPALIVLLLSLLWPRIWCGRLCPLGGLQDILAQAAKSGRHLLSRSKQASSANQSSLPLARRAVLGVAAGAASASVLRLTSSTAARPLRPPGAVAAPEFLGLCLRCGNCLRACPTHIIQPDLGGHGLTSLLSPVLSFASDYCREDCTACTSVCPSGALTPISLDQKPKARIGLPTVDMSICLLGADRECAECRRWCPYGAIRYVFSETDYALKPEIDPKKCNGCGACEKACPTTPKKAIVVAPLAT